MDQRKSECRAVRQGPPRPSQKSEGRVQNADWRRRTESTRHQGRSASLRSQSRKFSLWIQARGARNQPNLLSNEALGHLPESHLRRPLRGSLSCCPSCPPRRSGHYLPHRSDHCGPNRPTGCSPGCLPDCSPRCSAGCSTHRSGCCGPSRSPRCSPRSSDRCSANCPENRFPGCSLNCSVDCGEDRGQGNPCRCCPAENVQSGGQSLGVARGPAK